ncbi:DUF2732 family protein [Dickeya dianthicola]|uniref:DUF2732 family protein n=1 Tax=Dickeya dianthicola TaxID=204039 RepID=UPI0018683364|nr:DUF2732 family protein [Dickeya dianthicola]QOL14887.1 DUF2732 family protein [Dickeya dianthicola]
MKNIPINHQTSPARRQISNDDWRTDFAHRYSEHLDQLAQHARQEQFSAQKQFSAQELVALLQQEAEKIRHQIWEAH